MNILVGFTTVDGYFNAKNIKGEPDLDWNDLKYSGIDLIEHWIGDNFYEAEIKLVDHNNIKVLAYDELGELLGKGYIIEE